MNWEQVSSFFSANWPTVLRDLISIFGFGITIFTLWQTKKVAEAARDASRETTKKVTSNIAKIDAVSTLTLVSAKLDQIYEFQRRQSWERVPDFYKDARGLLAKVRGSGASLQVADLEYIQGVASELGQIEESIEERLVNQVIITDMPSINQIVSKHSEELIRIEVELRNRQGEESKYSD